MPFVRSVLKTAPAGHLGRHGHGAVGRFFVLTSVAACAAIPLGQTAHAATASGTASAEVIAPVEILYAFDGAADRKRQVQSICRPDDGPCPVHGDRVIIVLQSAPPKRQKPRLARSVAVQVYFE